MFDRIVLRAVRRIVRHSNRHADRVHEVLQVFFEQMMPAVVAAATIAQQQDRRRARVGTKPVPSPPQLETVARELARVVAEAERDVADIALQIVQAVRNDFALGEAGKVVVENGVGSIGVSAAGAEQAFARR